MALEKSPSQKPFRVVIVGAGIVGLSLSHALTLAKIDHVVFEKHSEIVSLHGAALTIFPSAARIFDQFGIFEGMKVSTTPVQKEYLRWPDGSVNLETRLMRDLLAEFDLPTILFDRQRCVTHLYDGLPDKSVIRTSTCVERIEHTDTGVKVYLTDGTFEEGDLVVGADGVHSLTRQLMWDYAAEHDPSSIPDSDKQALFTAHKGLYGVSDITKLNDPNLGLADTNVCLGHGVTKLLFTQPGSAMWALVYKDEYSQPPKRYKPDAKETEEVASRFKDLRLTENLTFSDLWESKTRCGLLNIEEGVLDKWHTGRIVLVGDAAHKVSSSSRYPGAHLTADIGIGANMAIESAAALANVLQSATSQNPSSPFHPSLPELSALFTKYQGIRHERAKLFAGLSGGVTRMRSYQSLWKRFFIGYIATLPFMQRYQAKKLHTGFAKAPKLEYVGTRTINESAAGWKVEEEGKEGGTAWVAYVLVTSVVGVAVSYAALLKYGRLL